MIWKPRLSKPRVSFRELNEDEKERVLDALCRLVVHAAQDPRFGHRRYRHIQNIRAYILNDQMCGNRWGFGR